MNMKVKVRKDTRLNTRDMPLNIVKEGRNKGSTRKAN